MWSHFACLVALVTIVKHTQAQYGSVITTPEGGVGTWTDDFTYTATKDSFSVETWCNANDLGTVSGKTTYPLNRTTTCTSSTCGGNGATMWGWYDNSIAPHISALKHAWSCTRYATARITVDMYFCDSSSSSDSINVLLGYGLFGTSDQTWYSNQFSSVGGTATSCSALRYKEYDFSFTTDPYDYFTLTFTPETSNRKAAWNNVQVTCTHIATSNPTTSPTSVTGAPSETPTSFPSNSPSSDPSGSPSASPTKAPTTDRPTESPTTPIPSRSPTNPPTTDPTTSPTTDPTEYPTERPTAPTRPGTRKPTRKPVGWGGRIDQALGGDGGDPEYNCTKGWVACNTGVFIAIILIVIAIIVYWIVGGVWYKHRQNNRPLPPQRGVEMAEDGAATGHATSNKWKSAWEIEQEQKQMSAASGADAGGGW